MKVSVIIVHYQVSHLLRNCIISIQKYFQGFEYEIIVVDNNSPNPEWKKLIIEFDKVKFIELRENLGFSKANNIGVKSARGEYIYILNPDTEIVENNFSDVLNFADHKNDIGAVGLRMYNLNGQFLPESKRSIPSLINSFEKLFTTLKNDSKSYYRNDIAENEIAEVEIITGANLLIKKDIYEEVGGFDERYFMYGEDIDLCYTILLNGYKNYYYGEKSILHYKGESTVKNKLYLKRFFGAMDIFIQKYYKRQKPLHYIIMKLGLRTKFFIEYLKLKK